MLEAAQLRQHIDQAFTTKAECTYISPIVEPPSQALKFLATGSEITTNLAYFLYCVNTDDTNIAKPLRTHVLNSMLLNIELSTLYCSNIFHNDRYAKKYGYIF